MTKATDPSEPADEIRIDLASARARAGQTPEYLSAMAKSRWDDTPQMARSTGHETSDRLSSQRGIKKWWTGIALAVSLLAVVTASAFAWERGRRVVEARNEAGVERTKAANRDWALEILKPKEYEQKQNLFVSYISPELVAVEAKGKVTVVARNVQFPCRIRWTVGNSEELRYLPAGETALEFPAGIPATVFCEPVHAAGWLQVVTVAVVRDGKLAMPAGSVLGKIPLTLMDGDTVVLHFDQPIPPWNAMIVPVRGEWILVTLERPWAEYETDKWLRKEWKGPEELPNTALFWAREGTAMLSKELAAFFIAHRNDTGHWGRFRGVMHTGITVRAGKNAVSGTMQEIEQKELELALAGAFELLRKQQPPLGRTIDDEIKKANEILKNEGNRIE